MKTFIFAKMLWNQMTWIWIWPSDVSVECIVIALWGKKINKNKNHCICSIYQFLWCKFSDSDSYQAGNITSLNMVLERVESLWANFSTPPLPLRSVWSKPICVFISSSVKWNNNTTFLVGLMYVKNSCASFTACIHRMLAIVIVIVNTGPMQKLSQNSRRVLPYSISSRMTLLKRVAVSQPFFRHYSSDSSPPPALEFINLYVKAPKFFSKNSVCWHFHFNQTI